MMSFEEAQELGKRIRAEKEKRYKIMEQVHQEELRKMGINPDTQKFTKPKYDHPNTLEDEFVTVLYVIGMVGSLIFKDFWIPWFILTIVYGKFITRHDND